MAVMWVRIVFDDCVGCGRMETFDLGAGGAMPSTPVSGSVKVNTSA